MTIGVRSLPVVVEGAMEDWPALMAGDHRWNLDYIKRVAGVRTVPVEVGHHYLSQNHSLQLMTVSDFIENYLEGDTVPGTRGYLAQHPLFAQIPALGSDIRTPTYCYLSEPAECADDGCKEPVVNGWLGPAGTITPCHHDPTHNLLAQVVGRKYVRLYPAGSKGLYPYESGECVCTGSRNLRD
eukprot:COSAG01_NODE_14218_length_1481_cov_50.969609_2_plen_183_part_00